MDDNLELVKNITKREGNYSRKLHELSKEIRNPLLKVLVKGINLDSEKPEKHCIFYETVI